MYAHPGKKLLFMGGEFAQFIEWNEWKALDWHLLEYDSHKGIQTFMKTLNHIYINEPCLYELDTTYDGYQWIEVDNSDESTISFERLDKAGNKLIAIFNFTPVARHAHPIGVSKSGTYDIILNTCDHIYGGNIPKPQKNVSATKESAFGHPYSIRVELPALGGLYIQYKEDKKI